MGYTKISNWRKAKVENGVLRVMQTNGCDDLGLEQGGYADRVYQMPYTGTLEDAMKTNDIGISDIDRCIESGDVVRQGRLIR